MRRFQPLASRFTLPLVALLLTLGLFLPTGLVAASSTASGGFLDLSAYSFADQGPVSLDGDWAFYWHQLLTPNEVAKRRPTRFATVPGGWNGAPIDGQPLPADGYATYHLQVKVANPARSYALSIRYMGTAYRMWVNGQPLAANGTVGTSPETSQPQLLPVTVHFTPQDPVIDLVVQVSNFDHRVGGVWNPIWFGPSEQLAAAGSRALALNALLIGAIIMIGLYHLILYGLTRNEGIYLWFGILSLGVALRLSLMDQMVLPRAWPGMPYELQLRLEYLTGYLAGWMIIWVLQGVFEIEWRPKWVLHGLYLTWAVLVLITLVAPVRYSSIAVLVPEVVHPIWLGWGLWLATRGILRGRRAGLPFLWGFALVELSLMNDYLVYNGLLRTPRLSAYAQIGLVLIQSWALALRYTTTLREQTRMGRENAQLYHRAQAHLEEVQQTRRLLTAREDQLRREIAEVLHGRVQTKLLMAAHRLEQAERLREADPAQARAQVLAALEQIDHVREEEIRQASHALHPSVIRVGLLPATRSLISRVAERLEVGLIVDPEVAALDDSLHQVLTEAQRLALYRALEEGLANVLAHAGTNQASVTLDLVGQGLLRLCVADDGVGFADEGVRDGLGLRSVGARIEELGGTWTLESNGAQGTLFTVTLPVNPTSAELPVT